MSKMLDHMLDWVDYAAMDIWDYCFTGCCLVALVMLSPVWLPLWAIDRVQQHCRKKG